MHLFQSLQGGPDDNAVLAKEEAGRYVGISVRFVVNHFNIVLELWRIGIVLGDYGTHGTSRFRL